MNPPQKRQRTTYYQINDKNVDDIQEHQHPKMKKTIEDNVEENNNNFNNIKNLNHTVNNNNTSKNCSFILNNNNNEYNPITLREIAEIVVEYCNGFALINLMRTCRLYYELGSEDYLWYRHIKPCLGITPIGFLVSEKADILDDEYFSGEEEEEEEEGFEFQSSDEEDEANYSLEMEEKMMKIEKEIEIKEQEKNENQAENKKEESDDNDNNDNDNDNNNDNEKTNNIFGSSSLFPNYKEQHFKFDQLELYMWNVCREEGLISAREIFDFCVSPNSLLDREFSLKSSFLLELKLNRNNLSSLKEKVNPYALRLRILYDNDWDGDELNEHTDQLIEELIANRHLFSKIQCLDIEWLFFSKEIVNVDQILEVFPNLRILSLDNPSTFSISPKFTHLNIRHMKIKTKNIPASFVQDLVNCNFPSLDVVEIPKIKWN